MTNGKSQDFKDTFAALKKLNLKSQRLVKSWLSADLENGKQGFSEFKQSKIRAMINIANNGVKDPKLSDEEYWEYKEYIDGLPED